MPYPSTKFGAHQVSIVFCNPDDNSFGYVNVNSQEVYALAALNNNMSINIDDSGPGITWF